MSSGAASRLRKQLADAEAEVLHLRNLVADQRAQIEQLSRPAVIEYASQPHPVGYSRSEPTVSPVIVSPVASASSAGKGPRFAYFGVGQG